MNHRKRLSTDSYFPDLHQEIDLLIRSGQKGEGRKKLLQLTKVKIPRAHVEGFAVLSRRLGLPELSVRMLNPIVRGTRNEASTATPSEKLEYAASLVPLGAEVEALSILDTLPSDTLPSVLLHSAFAYIAQWDYSSAIPLLRKYIHSKGLSDYQRFVGNVNLAAALATERIDSEATTLLAELRKEATEKKLTLLLGNLYEISAYHSVLSEKWEQAKTYLSEGDKILRVSGGMDQFFLRKWQVILKLLTTKPNKKTLEEVEQLKHDAKERGHWETVRDCDLFKSVAAKDSQLAIHLLVGTRFKSFQNRLTSKFGKLSVPQTYLWNASELKKKPKVLELTEGALFKLLQKDEAPLLLNALSILTIDFYRPLRVPTLHSFLYPEEYFNPVSSPNRIHQIMSRLKAWFKKNKIENLIVQSEGGYQLLPSPNWAIHVQSERTTNSAGLVWKEIKNAFSKPFTASELSEKWDMPPRSVRRLLKDGIDEKILTREGSGTKTRYRMNIVTFLLLIISTASAEAVVDWPVKKGFYGCGKFGESSAYNDGIKQATKAASEYEVICIEDEGSFSWRYKKGPCFPPEPTNFECPNECFVTGIYNCLIR